jgi:hypothetical protein
LTLQEDICIVINSNYSRMAKSKLVKALLIVAGLSGIAVGGALLVAPVAFEASAGIRLEENVNMLSEVRAPGGALLAGGVLILLGAFIASLTYTSVLLASLFFLSYGLSRILSIVVDGIPTTSLVMATIAEIIIGILSISILINFRKKEQLAVS